MTATLTWFEHAAMAFEPTPPPPDPMVWAQAKLGTHLWSKQREITESVTTHRRTAVRSCHGAVVPWLFRLA